MLQGLGPLLGVVVLAVGAAGGMVIGVRPPAGEPLGDFDHAGHIERGPECADCHAGTESGASAGVPSIRFCLEACHAEDVEETAMQTTANGRFILGHFQRGEEVWWPMLYDLPTHVRFSHQRHVVAGRIECATCHGDIASTRRLPDRPIEATLTMDGCIECHEKHGASNDCFACHK